MHGCLQRESHVGHSINHIILSRRCALCQLVYIYYIVDALCLCALLFHVWWKCANFSLPPPRLEPMSINSAMLWRRRCAAHRRNEQLCARSAALFTPLHVGPLCRPCRCVSHRVSCVHSRRLTCLSCTLRTTEI